MLAVLPYENEQLEFKDVSEVLEVFEDKDVSDGESEYEDTWRDELEDQDEFLECEEQIELYRPLPSGDLQESIISQDHLKASLQKLCYGDLYILGTLYINALKTVLVGAPLRLLPVVKAEKPPPIPEKPPKMKYKDLPIYKSPHYEYKEYIAEKDHCPERNRKLLHEYLLPHVKKYRKESQLQLCKWKCATKKTIQDMYCNIHCTKKSIKAYMRDPNNLSLRQGVVAGGILTGLLMGSTLTRKIIYSGIGGLATGALCFPTETDDFFRNLAYHSGKTFIALYNFYCKKNFVMRERVPCTDSVPPNPPKRKEQCPQPPGAGKWF